MHEFAPSLPEVGTENKDCFHVFIKDDEEYESTESFFISLAPYRVLSGEMFQPSSDAVIQPNVTEIFIIDDGMEYRTIWCDCCLKFITDAVIGFIGTPYRVYEEDGVFRVTIGVLGGVLTEEVFLHLSFVNGTALGEFIQNRIFIIHIHRWSRLSR